MQNIAFRCGLIALVFSAVVSSASAQKNRKIEQAANPKAGSGYQHKSADDAWSWPTTWQAPRPAVIPEQHSPAAGDHHNSDDEAKRRKDDSLSDARGTKADEIQAHYSRRQFQIGVAGAFVSALAAVFTAWAAFEAGRAAKAAKSAVELSSDIAERQLRAYISVTPKSVINWMNSTNRIMISFDIENHGQTIGFDIYYQFNMAILEYPQSPDFEELNLRYDQKNSLFPRMPIPVRLFLNRDITPDEVTIIEHGDKRFHTWGILHYRDAFNQMRTTKFSFSFGGPDFANSMRNVEGAHWNWDYGQHHNDAT